MYKLLKANFFRLVKNKIFWGIVIITILIASFILLNTILNHQGEIKAGIDNILIMYINFIGIFIAMFTSLFVGTEYSDGALRNKIVIGHSRKHIYFANMMTSIVVGICIELIYILIITIVGIPTLGTLQMSTEKFLFIVLDIIFIIIAYASIFTCVTLLYKKQIRFREEMRKVEYFLVAFLFLLITNFQTWYIMWLFPLMMWLKKDTMKLMIQISLISQFANTVFLINGEGWRNGTPFTFVMLLGVAICMWFRSNYRLKGKIENYVK